MVARWSNAFLSLRRIDGGGRCVVRVRDLRRSHRSLLGNQGCAVDFGSGQLRRLGRRPLRPGAAGGASRRPSNSDCAVVGGDAETRMSETLLNREALRRTRLMWAAGALLVLAAGALKFL